MVRVFKPQIKQDEAFQFGKSKRNRLQEARKCTSEEENAAQHPGSAIDVRIIECYIRIMRF